MITQQKIIIYNDNLEVWEVNFSYNESCQNVYKSLQLKCNGERTNLKKLKGRFIDIPDIFDASCYFWYPASTASARRANEKRRLREVEDWLGKNRFDSEEDRYTAEAFLQEKQNKFKKFLRGAQLHYDDNGIYVEYRKERYHISKITKPEIEKALKAIKIRREQGIKAKILSHQLQSKASKVMVAIEDSLGAGNCESLTKAYQKTLSEKYRQKITQIRGDELLKNRSDIYTIRAVNYAIQHKFATDNLPLYFE